MSFQRRSRRIGAALWMRRVMTAQGVGNFWSARRTRKRLICDGCASSRGEEDCVDTTAAGLPPLRGL